MTERVTVYRVNNDEFDEVYQSICSSRTCSRLGKYYLESLIPIDDKITSRAVKDRSVARRIRAFIRYHTIDT